MDEGYSKSKLNIYVLLLLLDRHKCSTAGGHVVLDVTIHPVVNHSALAWFIIRYDIYVCIYAM